MAKPTSAVWDDSSMLYCHAGDHFVIGGANKSQDNDLPCIYDDKVLQTLVGACPCAGKKTAVEALGRENRRQEKRLNTVTPTP